MKTNFVNQDISKDFTLDIECANYEIEDRISSQLLKITRYTPVLNVKVVASGKLSFAYWECFQDDLPEIHEKAKENALKNAREVIKRMKMVVCYVPLRRE